MYVGTYVKIQLSILKLTTDNSLHVFKHPPHHALTVLHSFLPFHQDVCI